MRWGGGAGQDAARPGWLRLGEEANPRLWSACSSWATQHMAVSPFLLGSGKGSLGGLTRQSAPPSQSS